jgi:hypothetical protein
MILAGWGDRKGGDPRCELLSNNPELSMMLGIKIDCRNLPYDPKSGRRWLVVCVIMTITGLALLASPVANIFDQGIAIYGHRVSLEFVPALLLFYGICGVIPAVMMLTPPSKR